MYNLFGNLKGEISGLRNKMNLRFDKVEGELSSVKDEMDGLKPICLTHHHGEILRS
jgi:hypothetical protein